VNRYLQHPESRNKVDDRMILDKLTVGGIKYLAGEGKAIE
jgi:hypothetical protein